MSISPKQVGRTTAIANMAANGTMSLPYAIEEYRQIILNQSTANVTIALPPPANTSILTSIDIVQMGAVSVKVAGVVIASGVCARMTWSGTSWMSAFVAKTFDHTYDLMSQLVADTTTTFNEGELIFVNNSRVIYQVIATRTGYLHSNLMTMMCLAAEDDPHMGWRIRIVETFNGVLDLKITEIEFRSKKYVREIVNTHAGYNVTSQQYNDNVSSSRNVFDGHTETWDLKWNTGTPPDGCTMQYVGWIYADTAINVAQIRIVDYENSLKHFFLDYSDDEGRTWKPYREFINTDPPYMDLLYEVYQKYVPKGGAVRQALVKRTAADFDTEWLDMGTDGLVPHAGWRVRFTKKFSGNPMDQMRLAELEFRQVAGVAEHPSGGTIVYSQQYNGNVSGADKAFDGDDFEALGWRTGPIDPPGSDPWLGYLYDHVINIQEVRLHGLDAYDVQEFYLEFSDDNGRTWEIYRKFTNDASPGTSKLYPITKTLLPTGGETGWLLAKSSGGDYDVAWVVPSSIGRQKVSELDDYDNSVAPTNKQLMQFLSATNKWHPWTLTMALAGLTDVDLTGAGTGYVLQLAASGKWNANVPSVDWSHVANAPAIPTHLSDITGDVTISSPQVGDLLRFDGTHWKNSPVDDSKVVDHGNVSGDIVINRAQGGVHIITPVGNVTSITFTGWGPANTFSRVALCIRNPGSNTVALPTARWIGKSASPELTAGTDNEDWFVFFTVDGGVSLRANVMGQDY